MNSRRRVNSTVGPLTLVFLMPMDARKILDEINRLVTEGADVDRFVPLITELVTEKPLSIGSTYAVGTQLYRATKHHRAAPTHISDLWFPPTGKAHLSR